MTSYCYCPIFCGDDAVADSAQIAAGLRLTEHFLLHHVLLPQGRVLPPARARLTERMLTAPRRCYDRQLNAT